MKSNFLFALLVTLIAPQLSQAGDRVGNGGGLWACTANDGQYQSAILVDLFEAKSEFQLFVPDAGLAQSPFEILEARKAWMASEVPELAKLLSPYFTRIENNLLFVEAQLQIIDDANFRVMPLASLCAGRWDYIQFANFTEYSRILIRKDFWESPVLGNLDKAALIVHEAVYLMLRERENDLNSVRARQITGLLFSNLPTSEISLRITRLMGTNKTPGKTPTAPNSPNRPAQWTCSLHNGRTSRTYLAGAPLRIEAEYMVNDFCEKQSGDLRLYCGDKPAECAPTQSATAKMVCLVKNTNTSRTYMGKGGNAVEAKALGLRECEAGSGDLRLYCEVQTCSNQ